MPTELLVAIVTSTAAAVSGIVCAVISSGTSKRQKADAKDNKDYREQRERLDKAKANVLVATMQGVQVLLHQAKGENLNGNVEEALDSLHEAKRELTDVRSEITSQV